MSKYLPEFWQTTRDQITVMLLTRSEFQLTQQEIELTRKNVEFTDQVYCYKQCHYGTTALFVSGEVRNGAHLYCHRSHKFNQCAESEPMGRAQRFLRLNKPDPIATLITHHANHDKFGNRSGRPYLASPCESCLRVLEQVSDDVLIVVDVDGQGRLAKAPIEVCRQYFLHPRKHNGE